MIQVQQCLVCHNRVTFAARQNRRHANGIWLFLEITWNVARLSWDFLELTDQMDRLTEQIDRLNGKIGNLFCMMRRLT
jgi:uncharacterized protein YfaT (DUF1175 family)